MENLPTSKNILARQFINIPTNEPNAQEMLPIFTQLESELTEAGFNLADTNDALQVFYDDSLLCRSESFTKVMDLLSTDVPISITNEGKYANMCVMASGTGFKTAMHEGFSGKDVGGIVKVVVSFSGNHLLERSQVPSDDNLWETKPQTAKVSLVGNGEIKREDLAMVSFRFPIKYFPNDLLSDDEKDLFEEDNIQFIVRHYIQERKKTAH